MADTVPRGPHYSRRVHAPLIVGLGEALFDVFPDSTRLGGAPVNLAVHANALLSTSGGVALPATRVGRDQLGDRFFEELRARGVRADAVQVDPTAATGRVLVTVDEEGSGSYRFEPNAAWDHLEVTEAWDRLAGECDAVAFGTLAQRSDESRKTVKRFLELAGDAVRLFDVNLRGDFYDESVLAESLKLASAVKLNAEELREALALLGYKSEHDHDPDAGVEQLLQAFDLDWAALTRGSQGTVLYRASERNESSKRLPQYDVATDADSVGAGDACCAALLVGATLGLPTSCTLDLANACGAFAASCPGATPTLPESIVQMVRGVPAHTDA